MKQHSEALGKFLQSVRLPAIPEVALALVRTLDDDDFHMGKVVGMISKDPAITAAVLKQANSAQYGLATKVTTVDDAARLIGFNNVRSIALAASVANAFPMGMMNKAEFWRSSETTANFSSSLAALVGEDKSVAWLAGFMLRVGELLIAQHDAGAVARIEQLPCAPGVRWQREHEILGLTEGQIIAELARTWNFPDSVVMSLTECADPLSSEWPFHKLSGVLHLAGVLSDMVIMGVDTTVEIVEFTTKPILQSLKISPEKVLKSCSLQQISLA